MSESALGKASSDSSQSDKGLTVECPTCGKSDFKSRQYMKIHHANSHGESIAGENVECAQCGELTKKQPYEISNYENNFCSDECGNQYKSENRSGEDSLFYDGGKNEYECAYCGESIMRYPSQSDCYERVYCDKECHSKHISESGINSGKSEEKWSHYECDNCGDDIQRLDSKAKQRQYLFCDRVCKNRFHSAMVSGSGNPNWDGGEYHRYYGSNWDDQRIKALNRDNHKCQSCGKTSNTESMSVHHIRKIRRFREEYDAPMWWEKANALGNLVTLCRSCHGKWEGIPLRPDTHRE